MRLSATDLRFFWSNKEFKEYFFMSSEISGFHHLREQRKEADTIKDFKINLDRHLTEINSRPFVRNSTAQ